MISDRLTRAAGYLRRSTNKQEKSLEDQRREIEKYAEKHGYTLVRWYVDDGISGDDTDKRHDFQRMHADACNGRDFDAILCWDQDRFGRFNSMEASYWIHPLMKAGVRLETVTDGPIDWSDFAGRMVYSIKQEGKHQYLIDLSGNVARRQIQNARDGYLCGQAAPYGFDRMILDEAGQPRQRVHNGEQFVKPRSWHVTLVPSDDPEKVKWAKWLFTTYANTDTGLRTLANELNKRGIPGPRGGKWWIGTIRALLGNEAFVGTFVWGKRGEGKYHRVAGGEIRRRNANGKKLDENPPETWTVVENAWEPLVDVATFKRVQAKLADRRSERGRPSQTTTSTDNYLLSGIVHCAHCGAKMFGHRRTRRKRGKTYESRRYVCSTYFTQGKEVCGCHSIDQAVLLDVLVRKLQEAVLCGGNRDELRRRVVDRLEARQAADPAVVEALRSRVAQFGRRA